MLWNCLNKLSWGLLLLLGVLMLADNNVVESKRNRRRKAHQVQLTHPGQEHHDKSLPDLQFEMLALATKLKLKRSVPLRLQAVATDSITFNEVKLGNAYNTEYFGTVKIGSKQSFKMLFDTASANLWVPSIQCPTDNCTRQQRYDHSLSSSYVPDNTEFQIQYATRNNIPTILKGFLSKDTVEIAGLSIKQQTFAEITSLPPFVFSKANFDGIFGLGFKDIAIGGVTPPFYKLIEQGLITQPTFSIYLNRNNTGIIDPNGGKLLLGPSDPTLYSGCMTYVPLSKVGYWQFTTTSITLGKGQPLCTNCETIIDVGTSLIVTPPQVLATINAQLGLTEANKRDGVYTLDCARVSSLPSMTFNIGRSEFVLTPANYIVQYRTTCVSGFTSLDDGSTEMTDDAGTDYSNMWIFGAAFMGPFYMEFDMGYKRIGIAPKI